MGLFRQAVRDVRLGGALVATTVLGASLVAGGFAQAARATPATPAAPVPAGCSLGNGISHVVQLTFDNVHFFRDNPNVPSDLEQMPALQQFIQNNGTLLSNNHTPLIAHTADDSLTNYTGLYGDRHGMGISNSYGYFTPTGTVNMANSFVYWTDPVIDDATAAPSTTDHNPSMIYSAQVPAKAIPSPATGVAAATPAPWVPYTRAGCNVGGVATANMVLENTGDIPQVFGASSPEATQTATDPNPYQDAETNDYIGVSVHCGQGPASAVCSGAKAVKYGQTVPSPTAVPDRLPDEPGGYQGFLALHGHKYVAPVLGAGTPNQTHNSYPVTNGAGNLVDLTGREIDGQYVHTPGFPGFGPISAAQTLGYMANMQEKGISVTYGYIADLHGNNSKYTGTVPACSARSEPSGALGPGDPCYEAQAAAYNSAFATFFARLAADGITPANTLFVFTADEGDHFAGANAGRALTPTCTGTPGTTTYHCTYPAGTLGELNTNLTGLLATQTGNTTSFSVHADSAPNVYVTGQPGATDPVTRNLERDMASLKANNPYAGQTNVSGTGQTVANWLADPVEERILHFVNADPARTPTFTLFAKPDYYLSDGSTTCPSSPGFGNTPTGTPCVVISPSYAWNHGDYAPEINTTWLGLVGPGVAHKGVDGLGPAQGPSSAGPASGQGTIPDQHNPGTWVDHTDIRPTMMALTGLKDDYTTDGRVITEDLTPAATPAGLRVPGATALGACYKQLNASVGSFGTDTLKADTAAIKTGNPANDWNYDTVHSELTALADVRDLVAGQIKGELHEASFGSEVPSPWVIGGLNWACGSVLGLAHLVANPI